MNDKKRPFIYRSFVHFYFIFILPTSVLTLIASELFNETTFTLDQLKSPGLWLGFLTFQLVFGTLMYFWNFKSRSKVFKDNT